ncbi:IS256 family transposase [Tepiditoga spiralis]|uniref:Mutator family transposase n=1 Tax=Tepiditoga spiralis TaxID=2108365 RepID=A0A7G1G5F4_9BACT|nr:IS256 family transposase [Tepiditoga spiralis]BBE31798.1 IS256 family transposase [Tepiditoga spiralis]
MGNVLQEIIKEMVRKGEIRTIKDIKELTKSLTGNLIQEVLEAELEDELGYGKYDREKKNTENSRNGYRKKNLKSSSGMIELMVPRDRKGEYEPKIVPKYSNDISEIEEKIISLYARGMTTRDISDQIMDLYGFEVSAELVSKITNKLMPLIKDWQERPLHEIYTFVFLDAIYFNVREDGRIGKKAAYVIIGVDIDGIKDVLGIYVGEVESAKFWMGVLNNLKNRGVKDILVASIDGLSGFEQAINATFPQTMIQRCIIHQIRNTLKYVPHKDRKEFAKDLKTIYTALDEKTGYDNLTNVINKWGDKYYASLRSWEKNWHLLSTFFQFSDGVRKIMYTTNIIESLNRQFRKATKTKSIFPNDDAVLKSLYLTTKNVTKKWTARFHNWNAVISELAILFEDRLKDYL